MTEDPDSPLLPIRTSTQGVRRSMTQCAAVSTTPGATRLQPQYRKLLLSAVAVRREHTYFLPVALLCGSVAAAAAAAATVGMPRRLLQSALLVLLEVLVLQTLSEAHDQLS
jgi:hypothetical protein